jgi:hypothetical protein
VIAPNVRIWPIAILESNGVAVAVSQQFNGPAVITHLVAQFDVNTPAKFPDWSLYVATESSGGGNNQALGTVPTGTRLFDSMTLQREDAVTAADLLGVPYYTQGSNVGTMIHPLGLRVDLATFFIKLRLANNAGVTVAGLQGYIRVVESVPPEQLANFL